MRQVKITKISEDGEEQVSYLDIPEKINDLVIEKTTKKKTVRKKNDNSNKKQKEKQTRSTNKATISLT